MNSLSYCDGVLREFIVQEKDSTMGSFEEENYSSPDEQFEYEQSAEDEGIEESGDY